MPDPLVIWDIDGTLLNSSMEYRLLHYLIRHDHTSYVRIAINAIRTFLTRFSLHWRNFKLSYFRGSTEEDVATWIEGCWKESIEPDLYSPALDTIKRLHAGGIRQVLLSGTALPLAERMAKHIGLADVIAAAPEIVKGCYTGAVVKPHPRSRRKRSYADKWLNENGHNWGNTCVIADHWDDRFLMSQARVAVAVMPEPRLATLAAEQGWLTLNSVADYQGLADVIEGLLVQGSPPSAKDQS